MVICLFPNATIDPTATGDVEELRRAWDAGELITLRSLDQARAVIGAAAVNVRLAHFAALGIYLGLSG
jgi:hypothetical protein